MVDVREIQGAEIRLWAALDGTVGDDQYFMPWIQIVADGQEVMCKKASRTAGPIDRTEKIRDMADDSLIDLISTL